LGVGLTTLPCKNENVPRSLQKFGQIELPVATSGLALERDRWKKNVEEAKS
jgi:hypothetical protein